MHEGARETWLHPGREASPPPQLARIVELATLHLHRKKPQLEKTDSRGVEPAFHNKSSETSFKPEKFWKMMSRAALIFDAETC